MASGKGPGRPPGGDREQVYISLTPEEYALLRDYMEAVGAQFISAAVGHLLADYHGLSTDLDGRYRGGSGRGED